jgi:anti-sigma factor RsiW
MTGNRLDDSRLVAYVDGELGAAEAAVIEHALRHDPEAARRVEVFRNTADWLRAAYPASAAVTSQPAAAAAKAPRPAYWRTARWTMPVAASIVAFAVGLGGGYVGASHDLFTPGGHAAVSESDAILDEIVEYYRLYWMDGRYLVERPAAERHSIDAWMTTRFNRQVIVPNLDGHGLAFQGARVMALAAEGTSNMDGFHSQSTMVLVYHTPEKRVVSVIASKAKGIANTEPAVSRRSGKNVISWVNNGIRFTLVGGVDASLLAKMVPDLRSQFSGS